MQRAKAFFLVCAGILLLALAYHLGATTATAQAPGNPVTASFGSEVFTANGDAYLMNAGSWVLWENVFSKAGHSSTSPIVTVRQAGASPALAITAAGDMYEQSIFPSAPGWTYAGNLFALASTPAAQPTWGQLKTQYRK